MSNYNLASSAPATNVTEIRLGDLETKRDGRGRGEWVRPEKCTAILNPIPAFDELMARYLSAYRIEIKGSPEDDRFRLCIEELRATCPYCSAGANQTLTSENWVQLFDWSSKSITRLYNDYRLKGKDIESNMEAFNRSFFNLLESSESRAKQSPSSFPGNVYGISINDLCELNPYQMSLGLSEAPLSARSASGAAELTGVYRCPHCGSDFAVSLCKDEGLGGSPEERAIREAMLWHLARDKSSLFNTRIIQTASAIEVKCTLNNYDHSVLFDVATGATLFDGRGMLSGEFGWGVLAHPVFESSLFGNSMLAGLLAKMLSIPHSMLSQDSSRQNLRMLIAGNRFIGYPESFYWSLATSENLFLRLCDARSFIPRRYEDLKNMFEYTRLPDDKSIKRRLFSDPLLFCKVLMAPDIPFKNPGVLRRFLDLPHDNPLYQALLDRGGLEENRIALSIGLGIISDTKGETAVFDFATNLSCYELDGLAEAMGEAYWMCSGNMRELIEKTPLEQLEWSLRLPSLEERLRIACDEPYRYTEEQRQLEDSVDSFEFQLPSTPKDAVKAAIELSNHDLAAYASKHLETDLLVLIAKGGKYVGAIEISSGGHVQHACTAHFNDLTAVAGLLDAFSEWRRLHGITVQGFEEMDGWGIDAGGWIPAY